MNENNEHSSAHHQQVLQLSDVENVDPNPEKWNPQIRNMLIGISYQLAHLYDSSYQGHIQEQAQIIARQQEEIAQRGLMLSRRDQFISSDLEDLIRAILDSIINIIDDQ